jgi:hypothetical protein
MTRLLAPIAFAASLFLACGSSGAPDGGADAGVGGGCAPLPADGGGVPDSGYCNGALLQSRSCAAVYAALYPESSDVQSACGSAFAALSDAGAVIPKLGGILDTSSYSSQGGLLTLFPSGCEDLGQGAGPTLTATSFTPPSGASTVAAVRIAQKAPSAVYGIVTFVDAPSYDLAADAGADGTLYLQDLPGSSGPAPLSGIAIYIDDQYTGPNGTVGYPDSGVERGDVVAISGLAWSPYQGQQQLAWSSTASLSVLGIQPLPPSVALTAADIAGSTGQQYLGMRVTQTDVPDAVVNECPAVLHTNGG